MPINEPIQAEEPESTNTTIIFAKTSPEEWNAQRDNVRIQRANSRDASYMAIAHCTILGLCCLGKGAQSFAREWLSQEIDSYNSGIELHNKEIAAAQKRAVDFYATGKLQQEDHLSALLNDPDAIAAQEAAKGKLRDDGAKEQKYWDDQKRSPVKPLVDGGNNYNSLVRVAYSYDEADDAPAVSELARIVGYLIDHEFKDDVSASVETIMQRIRDRGGKAKLLKLARHNETKTTSNPVSFENDPQIFNQYRQKLAAAAANASAQDTVVLNMPDAKQGDLVLMLGRKDMMNTTVLAPLSIDDALLKKFAANFNEVIPIEPSAEIAFLTRLLAFMPMVSVKAHGNVKKLGPAENGRRVLVVGTDKNGLLYFLLTAQHVEATPLVKATLKDALKFAFSGTVQFTTGDALKGFVGLLEDNINRYLIEGSGNTPDGMFMLSLVHSTKMDNGGNPYTVSAGFLPVADEYVKPIFVDQHRTAIQISLAYADAKAFYDEKLAAWEKQKRSGDAILNFGPEGFEYNFSGAEAYHVAGDGNGSLAQLTLRPNDLQRAFAHLLSLKCQSFDLEVDAKGLLKITCEDEFATYELFIPAISGENYQNSRFEPIAA